MKNKKTKTMLILALLLLGITIGYAALSSNLSINGTSTIDKPTWDIHFENIQTKSGSITPTTAANIINATTVTYAVTFNTPGEYYEFDVDVKNSGTIDGMIESVTSTVNNQPISNLPNYIEYYVTYEDGVEIAPNHLLAAGEKETYTVHIGFKRDINPEDLPDIAATYELKFGFSDIQASSSATERETNYVYTIQPYEYTIIGEALPADITIYNDYNSAISNFGASIFLKHLVKESIISKSYIGYINKNKLYNIRGGNGFASYEENKSIVNESFDSSTCIEDEELYNCYDSVERLSVTVYRSGKVMVQHPCNDSWTCVYYCVIHDNGASFCTSIE